MPPYWLIAAVCLLALAGCTAAPTAPAISPAPQASSTPPPSPTADPTGAPTAAPPACRETAGKVERLHIPSAALTKGLDFGLYTPPCFDPHAQPAYPLLVMLHGQSFTDDQWPRLGLTAAADRLIAAGEIAPLVMVFPYEEYSLQDPGQSGFGRAIADDLLPWLEAHYPVCTARSCRAVGGLSRGAAWAVRLGFDFGRKFGAVGAHSLPPFQGDFNRMRIWVKALRPADLPALALDMGENDLYRPETARFEALLTELSVPHAWRLSPGQHDEAYWSAHVEDYLRWYGARLHAAAAPRRPVCECQQ